MSMFADQNFYDESGAVEVVQPVTNFDEPPAVEPERDAESLAALLSVVFELGAWAGKDPLKQWAARSVMRQEDRRPCEVAKKYKVSTAYLRKLIGIARKQIGYASNEGGMKN